MVGLRKDQHFFCLILFALILLLQVPPTTGQWSNCRMHSCQIFLGQVQDEIKISSFTMSTSGSRTQTHIPASRGVQHSAWPEVHQKIDRHANIYHDQGHSTLCS